MMFGTCKLHTTRNGAMQILRKFCHTKHLTESDESFSFVAPVTLS